MDRGGTDPYGLAVPVLVVQVEVRLALLAIADRRQQRALLSAQDRSRSIAVIQDHVLATPSEEFLGAEPGDPFRATVPVHDAPLAIDEVDAIAEVLKQRVAELRAQADHLALLNLLWLTKCHDLPSGPREWDTRADRDSRSHHASRL